MDDIVNIARNEDLSTGLKCGELKAAKIGVDSCYFSPE